jgi:hypothetical protein
MFPGPGYEDPTCPCGEAQQTSEHVLECHLYGRGREEMYAKAGTRRFREFLVDSKKFKELAKWWVSLGIQAQWTLVGELHAVQDRPRGENRSLGGSEIQRQMQSR